MFLCSAELTKIIPNYHQILPLIKSSAQAFHMNKPDTVLMAMKHFKNWSRQYYADYSERLLFCS